MKYRQNQILKSLFLFSFEPFNRAAVQNANDAVQIFGGMGFNTESPVEKLYRDAKSE